MTENNEMWKCDCIRNSLYDYTYLFIYLFVLEIACMTTLIYLFFGEIN
jgi:hypothetical protein